MKLTPSKLSLSLLMALIFISLALCLWLPALWYVPPALGLAVLGVSVLDGLFAPPSPNLTAYQALPKTLGVGRKEKGLIEFAFKGFFKPQSLEVRLELNEKLKDSTYQRLLIPQQNGHYPCAVDLYSALRGRGEIIAAHVRWRGPFGLGHQLKRLELNAAIAITPDIEGVMQDASALFSRDSLYGVRVENRLNDGSEYYGLREYDASQDHRRIDWRTSARHHKLYAREFQAERNHHVVMVFDTGRLMGEPLRGLKRLDRALHAGLLLGYSALKIGDQVKTFAFASRPYHNAPLLSGTQAYNSLRANLSGLEDSFEESNHTLSLTDLNAKLRRRSLVVIFTDFIDSISAELMLEALERLNKKHQIVFVAFKDEVVDDLMQSAPESLEDVTRAVLARSLMNNRDEVLLRLKHAGVEILDVPTEGLSVEIVNTYLSLKRQNRL